MIGRRYLDPGDRSAGCYHPPRLCVVLTGWGPGGGPRNVHVRYLDDGTEAVIPFPRRLRRGNDQSWQPTQRRTVASTIKAAKLRVGDWFIDPRREGHRPAKVISITGTVAGRVHLVLDDNTRWSQWAASYNTHEDLELT